MSSLALILEEVNTLPEGELNVLLHILIDKVSGVRPLRPSPHNASENIFRQYRGIAKGIWNQDAQEYINELRNEDRF